MSVLVVGLSHSSAPVATLERAVVTGDAQVKLLQDVHLSDNVAGSFVLSTCNRVEIYAEVDRFHGGVAAICELLARHSGLPLSELTESAYVHYEDRAVQHLLAVTCGLESMVVGESQILGQVRKAITLARQQGTLSRELSELGSLALRTGRRAHAETGIDAAGRSLVGLGLELAAGQLARPAAGGRQAGQDGQAGQPPQGGQAGEAGQAGQAGNSGALAGVAVLVVGAGSMSSLAVATAARQGAGPIVISNRTSRSAMRLAAKFGAGVASLTELPAQLAVADLVIACTGATGHVISAAATAQALRLRQRGRPLVLLDLALPRDIEPGAGRLPGAVLIDLEVIAATGAGSQVPARAAGLVDVAAVRLIVASELGAYLQANRAARVAPTVVALRAKAATVVESELARLERRLGDLDSRSRREIAQSMGRIADKLLHGPTVRVKELAGSPGADSYETAIRVLFELDPDLVQAVASPEADKLAWPVQEGNE